MSQVCLYPSVDSSLCLVIKNDSCALFCQARWCKRAVRRDPLQPAENMGAVSGAPLSRDIVLRLPCGRRPAPPIPLLHATFPGD